MRDPEVLPLSESPFDLAASAEERHRRAAAVTADVFTDEHGLTVGFRDGDDVEALLTDPNFRAVAMDVLALSGVTEGPLHEMWSLLMFGKDGTDHRRLRGPVSKAFTPRAVEQYRPAIEATTEELADHMTEAQGPVELWTSFAVPLAARAACRVVGIPDDDADFVATWAIDLVGAFFFMDEDMRSRAGAAADAFLALPGQPLRIPEGAART